MATPLEVISMIWGVECSQVLGLRSVLARSGNSDTEHLMGSEISLLAVTWLYDC